MRCKTVLRRFFHRCMYRRISRKLELDTKQQRAFEQLQFQLETSQQACSDARHSHRNDLRRLLEGDKFDRDQATSLLQDGINNVEEYGKAIIERVAEFIDSLEPHQRHRLRHYLDRRCCCGV